MDHVTPAPPPGETQLKDYNYWALVLGVPLILVIILGNILVCLSVLTEPSLKTATNYFIISLAVADLLLAVLVLPLYVYSEVSEDASIPSRDLRRDSHRLVCVVFSFWAACGH